VERFLEGRFRIEAGKSGRAVRVVDEAGKVRTDPATGQPLTVGQFVDELRQSQDFGHLFAEVQPGQQAMPKVNPWKAGSVNLTEQGRITREAPEMAARLRAEASQEPAATASLGEGFY